MIKQAYNNIKKKEGLEYTVDDYILKIYIMKETVSNYNLRNREFI